ncbi:hypothetical protein [Pseudomonas sp. SO81]|uniref:hypothetical protein n=1 Tax=Pseudomonas sp. SO81 TaxID=2983246 RepID=UPI0025A3DAB1|nr:hypothetical protein [Pseudomonas sp. SO81]WJN60947.1 hypothetical protein OH686_19555 [Pseudomonas sp. SO81]
MLLIRMNHGSAYHLDRKLSDAGGWGVWDFHRSASTYTVDHGRTTYRYARIRPADPADGKTVEVFLMPSPNAPEETWIARGEGVVSIHSN